MFLTKECDYGIRIVRGLADGQKRSVSELCEAECVPQQYAYKILKKLEKSGIVQGFRGPAGGYKLKKNPANLTILDIAMSVSADVLLLECLKEGFRCQRNRENAPCCVHRELCRIQKVITEVMSEKNLAEIIGSAGI